MSARLLRLAPIGLLALSSTAFAQVFPTRSFEGELLHDFTTNLVGQYKVVRTPVANFGAASILGYDVRASFESATCGSITPQHGDQLLFTNDEYCVDYPEHLRVDFRDPVQRFGAYIMGGETEPLELSFRFLAADGSLLGIQDVSLPAGCDWHWVGHELMGDQVAQRLVIHNAQRKPVVIDSLTADLGAATPVGTNFCTPQGANSTGAAAHVSGFGSNVAAEARLELRAESVPDGYALFFYGDSQTSVPFGNGTRCVGSSTGIARLCAGASEGGVVRCAVDVAADPRMTSGSTWYFQLLFRDPLAGGSGLDLSDGLALTFR